MLCSDGHGAKNISLSISDENYEVSFVSTHQNINTISSPVKNCIGMKKHTLANKTTPKIIGT